ncbi:heat shock factor-binding protein 1-like protein 1 isoform X1 [Paroedura picta]|uniref:heat shock factor-binding protein 1-like protein 1 isoform X1 n=1 Tax=Paroedura picta TaxID=143630 RepID=UPI004055D3AD
MPQARNSQSRSAGAERALRPQANPQPFVTEQRHLASELQAENLLQQVHDNFQALADKLTLRMEDMGEHIDDLEKHVNGLLTQAGVQNASEELTP